MVSAEVLPHCMRGERDGSFVAAPSVGCCRTRGTHALLYTLSLASLRVIWLTFSQIREFLVDSAGTVSGLSDREVRVIGTHRLRAMGAVL